MKKREYITLALVASVLSACGGGGSSNVANSSSNNTASTLKSITGMVPGTLIEALCKDGSYYKTSSIQNGTTKHPFTLKIPKNLECKFIMTTNENDPNRMAITPLKFKTTNGSGSYLLLEDDLDIGYIPLDMNSSGVKQPLEVFIDENVAKAIELSYDPLDKDKDGIPNIYEDDDGDGKVNKYDEDDDNDGIIDSQDSDYKNDKDGDGIEDKYDKNENNYEIDDKNKNNNHNTDNNSGNNNNQTTTPITKYTPNDGRLLGSVGCTQCHGTNGVSNTSWDSIAGEGEFASENFRKHPIMQTVADGYNNNEKRVIDSWLNKLSKRENGGGDEDDD